MATPARFFSTLAQATGIIIGFIIALATAIYSTKRSRVHNRLSRFRRDVTKFEQEYGNIISDMADELRRVGRFRWENQIYRQNKKPIEVVEDVTDWSESQENPRVAKLWICLQWLSHQLSVLQGGSDLESMREQMTMTERPILHIISEFQDMENPENPRQERLFSELMERQGNLRKEYDPQRAVFDSSEHIDHWVRENTTRSNGRSFKSWEVIADNITREYYAIDGRQHLSGTAFDNDEFRTLLIDAAILFFVGVLVPMLFLTTIPPNTLLLSNVRISGIGILIVEILSLLAILGGGAKTLRDVIEIIE